MTEMVRTGLPETERPDLKTIRKFLGMVQTGSQKKHMGSRCWRWMGAKNDSGYGVIRTPKGLKYVHRLSFVIFRGPIEEGVTVDHLCHNILCVNPDHLGCATVSENVAEGNRRRNGVVPF